MEEIKDDVKDQSLVHDFNTSNSKFSFSPKIALIFVVVVLLGLGSGYVLSTRLSINGKTANIGGNLNSSSISKGTTVGSNDTNTFKDTAQGILKQGGIDGEGAFHLERPGGSSQNVYLTSSTVDMTKFVDKKIKVWGQTQKAQHAGWLMDVGRVEVL
ncbi:MAG: hypothetical protein M1405_03265 [Patescibacteria group bacterium]|nr:hypothetical protein [Patescibacteria group bacterium]